MRLYEKNDEGEYSEHCVQCALDTLTEAEAIKEDEELMELVSELAQKEVKRIKSIDDLKKAYDEVEDED